MSIVYEKYLDRKSKLTKDDSGLNKMSLNSHDIAYKDANNILTEVNTAPSEDELTIHNKTNSIKPTILKNPAEPYNIIYKTDYGLEVSFDLRDFKYINEQEEEEEIIATPLEASNYITKNLDGVDSVIQSQINQDIVDIFEISGGNIKRSIYLEKKPQLSTINADLFVISHKVKTNQPVNILLEDVVQTSDFITDKDIKIDIGLDDYMLLNKPIMFDNNNSIYNLNYRFKFISETEFELDFIFNVETLSVASYPLVIDPTSSIYTEEYTTITKDFYIPYNQTASWSASLYAVVFSRPSKYFINGNVKASNDPGDARGEYSGNISLSRGTHTHAIQSRSYSGNSGEISWSSDITAPSISVSNSGSSWTNNNQSVKITASDSQSGVANVYYNWNTNSSSAGSWSSISNGGTTSLSSQGTYYLHVKAVDREGNTRIKHYGAYRIDKTTPNDPNVSVTNTTTNSVSLSWNVGDSGGSGVDRVILYFQKSDSSGNNIADIDIDGDGSTEYSLNVGTANNYTINGLELNQYYRYYIRVYDNAGNYRNDGYHVVKTDAIKQITIGGTNVQDITIDGQVVKEITIDGQVVWKI